ncbi:T9SS type A sorting domain-containing protein [Parabacteroides sp. OttesenSCG-928-G06]|nr:T9SS type A sorting domain-containing protein [Parabacteroides sp. OttesenSCG-928-K15]MDL2281951.1 T9SS type A sorting domain-containing protein [Parabacteroides sp. OttesenSCG-928-G06]
MKTKLFLLLLLPYTLWGQVTSEPVNFSDKDAVEVIFNAAEGNKGLQGYTGDVYAHTGVITDKSSGSQDWQYAPTWGDNQEKYKLTPLGNDKWKLSVTPDVRSFYKVPEGETILKLAFVFRSADSKKEGKAAGNADIFLSLGAEAFTPAEPEAKQRPQGITDGINYINDNTVTLLLYAPGKKYVHLMGDFNNWKKDNNYQFYKDGDYWWYTLTGLEKDKEYGFQYLIDNSFKTGDAYAEKILDPLHDSQIPASTYPSLKPYPMETDGIVSVFRTTKKDYPWKVKNFNAPAKEELVIYEMLVRDFTEEGTIMAARERLDYLEALGINAIELMPIHEFDGNSSWGYDPCFFFAADKAYGTPEAYKAFIDEAHARGIAVILDVVFNHATGQHPFARLYWEGDAPAADNPWFNISAPHPYSVFNDFNHEYAGTRDYFKRVLTYWLEEYKVDGFRFDLSKGYTQKQSTEATAGNYDASRVAILKDYNSHVQSAKQGAYVILEHFCDLKEEKELAEAGMMVWNNVNDAYAESLMGWNNSQSNLTMGSYSYRGWDIPALVTYSESHDEERLMYKMQMYGKWAMDTDKSLRLQRAALGAAFLFATPGPKMIWQFGELGYDISINEGGRTGEKPVLWEYIEDPLRKELYEVYATLIRFRRSNPELFIPPVGINMQTTANDWNSGRAIRLQSADKDLVLLGNFTETAIDMPAGFTTTGTWKELFSDISLSVTEETKEKKVTLPPHAYKLFFIDKQDPDNNMFIREPEPFDWSYDKASGNLSIYSVDPVDYVYIYNVTGARQGVWKGTDICNIRSFQPGVYIFQVKAGGQSYSRKFVK